MERQRTSNASYGGSSPSEQATFITQRFLAGFFVAINSELSYNHRTYIGDSHETRNF